MVMCIRRLSIPSTVIIAMIVRFRLSIKFNVDHFISAQIEWQYILC